MGTGAGGEWVHHVSISISKPRSTPPSINLANCHACACDHPRHPCQRVRCATPALPVLLQHVVACLIDGEWQQDSGSVACGTALRWGAFQLINQQSVQRGASGVCGGGCESPALGLCVHVNGIVVCLPACRLMACATLGEWVCALAALRLHFVNSFCAFL